MKQIFSFFAVLTLTIVFGASVDAQPNGQASQSKGQNADKPLKITKKPQPSARGCQPGNGRMQLRATFDKSAVVTNIELKSASGCDAFDRSAMQAAKNIKFEPATKDGNAVTVVRTVEYVYAIY